MPLVVVEISLAFVAIVILILLIYIKVQVTIDFSIEEPERLLYIEIFYVYNRRKKQYQFSRSDLLELIPFVTPRYQHDLFISNLLYNNRTKKIYNRAMKFTVVDRFIWKTRVGIDDAMYTAILTGIFWSFKGIVLSLISRKSKLKQTTINVTPDFVKNSINSRLFCILKMRIVHIIIIVIYVIGFKVRRYIDGYTAGTTEPSH